MTGIMGKREQPPTHEKLIKKMNFQRSGNINTIGVYGIHITHKMAIRDINRNSTRN